MRILQIAMSGLFSLAIAPILAMALTFGDSGWTMLIGPGVMLLATGIVVAMHMARSKREFRYAEPEPLSDKISSQLVALSSAAILAVYSAGYLRTRPAANHFLEQAAQQRAAAAVATSPLPPASPDDEIDQPAAPSHISRTSPSSLSSARSRPSSETGPGAKPNRNLAPRSLSSPAAQPDASADAGDNSATAANRPTPAAMPQPVQSGGESSTQPSGRTSAGSGDQPGATGAQTGPAAAPTPTPAAAPTPVPVKALAEVRYKDGTYQGWGTCRHGDIQATVVVDGGKIASADISKCYTRYPCDIISQLPGQVVSRQSVAVDYVSGATQSVYAFQEAVAQALALAKAK